MRLIRLPLTVLTLAAVGSLVFGVGALLAIASWRDDEL